MTSGGQHNKKYKGVNEVTDKWSEMHGGKEFMIFDTNGNYIKTTTSQTAFSEEIHCTRGSVTNCLSGKKAQVKGYILIFKDEFSDEKLQYIIDRIKHFSEIKPDFVVINKETNKLLGIWNNFSECVKIFKCNRKTIANQLNKTYKNSRKYIFRYVTDLSNEEIEYYKLTEGAIN